MTAKGSLRITLTTEQLGNGEALSVLTDTDTGELIDAKVLKPQHHCHDCNRRIAQGENAFGIEGKLYCTPCGDDRLTPPS